MIVYKKTDEWYIEWQRVVQRVTTSDNEWQQVAHRVKTSETRSGKNSNEWQRMTISYFEQQRKTTNDNEWQRVVILTNFPFFRIREELTNMHPKEPY